MSRLGKLPIKLQTGIQARLEDNVLFVKGPKGELSQKIHELVKVKIEKDEILVSIKNSENKKEKAFWGLFRSLINNMVIGVETGFEKKLEVNGVGYRVALQEKKLILNFQQLGLPPVLLGGL